MKNKGSYLILLLTLCVPLHSSAQIYINEIMFDPTPNRGVGINTEYIELYNADNQPFEANGLILKDAKGSSFLPDFTIPNGGYVLLIPKNAVLEKTLDKEENVNAIVRVTKWLSLNNDNEIIKIEDRDNNNIDSFSFKFADWKSFEDFKAGGVSLERLQLGNGLASVCKAKSFSPSYSPSGGSPAIKNTVPSNDNYSFKYQIKDEDIDIFLSHQKIASIQNITLKYYDNQEETVEKIVDSRFFSHKINNNILSINKQKLVTGYKYKFILSNITFCNGKTKDKAVVEMIFPLTDIKKNNLIVTKVMYAPLSERSEFIEITNPTNFYISLKDISLQRLSADKKVIINISHLSDKDVLVNYGNQLFQIINIPPMTSWTITTNAELFSQQFPRINHENILECKSSCPTLPNQGGVIKIVKNQLTIDEIAYHDDFHTAFLKETKGIFLMRKSIQNNRLVSGTGINLDNLEQSFLEMHKNRNKSNFIEITPKILDFTQTPDNHLTIKLPKIDEHAQITIIVCNKKGYPMTTFVENEVVSDQTSWHFNPFEAKNISWQSGRYIIVIKLIEPENGIEELFKDTFILYF